MISADLYVGAVLVAMFVVGLVLIVRWRRQQSKTREQWSEAPRP
jgi:hypothetical protein